MSDEQLNGLAHELWAIAQGRAPIEDVIAPMVAMLEEFWAQVIVDERERARNP